MERPTDEDLQAAIDFETSVFGDGSDPWPFDGYHPEDFGSSIRQAAEFARFIMEKK